jgi:hypothetical protein
LGHDPTTLATISHSVLREFRRGPPISLIHQIDNTPDEIIRVEMLKAAAIQSPIEADIYRIGDYINPSIELFHGRFLLGVSLQWGITDGFGANEHIVFRWLNTTKVPFYSAEKYLGIRTDIISDAATSSSVGALLGQDPRFLKISEDVIGIYYTYRFTGALRMGSAYLIYNGTTNQLEVTDIYPAINPDRDHQAQHKNWSPFYHKNETYLIQRVNPLHVVRVQYNPIDQTANAVTVSIANLVPLHYDYGEVRGGTNAIHFGDKYLAFFHSNKVLPFNGYKTYFIGAYTFTSEAPFTLLAATSVPLLFDERMYTGAWDPLRNRRIDYVLFPMNCFLIDEGRNIAISVGRNDIEGYLVTVAVSDVFDRLEAIEPL